MNADGPGNAPVADDPSANEKDTANSLLLGELRKYAAIGDLAPGSHDLAGSLDEARRVLAEIKVQNRTALRNANRQPRNPTPGKSPNIVLVVSPRLGIGDLGSYGQTNISTPHSDAMAEEGVRLTDFYAGDPLPRASHWTLQTGWTAPRSTQDYLVEESTRALAEILWQGGYDTAFYGMWLAPDGAKANDSPLRHGYDVWMGQLLAKDATIAYPKSIWVNDAVVEVPQTKKPIAVGDLIVRAAIEELERHQHPRRPLFMTVVLPPYIEMAAEFADEELSDNTEWPREAQSYGAAVRMTDRDLGRIREAIERLDLSRRTCVIFTALTGVDQTHAQAVAFFKSNGRFHWHESRLGEANLRVPFLAIFPGVLPAGKVVARPGAMWDLPPTLVDLTYTRSPRKFPDAVSFAPLLRTSSEIPAHLLYWRTSRGQAARLGPWKGLAPGGSDALRLYNLETNPAETKDVADRHPEFVKLLLKPTIPE